MTLKTNNQTKKLQWKRIRLLLNTKTKKKSICSSICALVIDSINYSCYTVHVCVCHLGLLLRCVRGFPVDDAKADALWLGRENPADSVAVLVYGDGDDAVTAGLDEELARGVAEPLDLIDVQLDRGATHIIRAAK